MKMFGDIEMAPQDAILGITEAFQKDPNPAKINLSVGVYKDAQGKTPILESVKLAERRLLDEESTKGYLPISGSPQYARLVQEMLFSPGHELIESGQAVTSHTPGGTGALRVAGDLIHKVFPKSQIWLSSPTWPNHPKVFAAAGVQAQSYPYFDAEAGALNFDAMLAALAEIPQGDIVLLHGCCHNPSGVDPTADQWTQIADVVRQRKLLPLVDFAYQGFAQGLREDAACLEAMCKPGTETIICSSFSKNFGLYRERVGALTIVADAADAAERIQSQVKSVIRANYSNPPSHGADIVTTILSDQELRTMWEGELAAMRARIRAMRDLFVEKLAEKGVPGDYSFIKRQNGMFSFSGLNPEQVKALRDKYSIYIVGSGRINVAGMTESNMDALCEAIAEVV
jgi:aspartate/tyrosine/aromatic aminotransferase